MRLTQIHTLIHSHTHTHTHTYAYTCKYAVRMRNNLATLRHEVALKCRLVGSSRSAPAATHREKERETVRERWSKRERDSDRDRWEGNILLQLFICFGILPEMRSAAASAAAATSAMFAKWQPGQVFPRRQRWHPRRAPRAAVIWQIPTACYLLASACRLQLPSF